MIASDKHLTGVRKAAILLVLLGDEIASEVYRNLPQMELRRLTSEIADLGYISPESASNVLEEYHKLTMTQYYVSQGGSDYANQLLVKAFGREAADELLDQVVQAQEASSAHLESLQMADPQQLVKFVEGEHPQTIALVLAHLGAKSSSSLLGLLPEKVRADTVQRLAEMRQFSPEIAEKISTILNKQVQGLGEQGRRAYAGIKAVADLLNRIDLTTSKEILESIEADDAQLAISIRNLMFIFDDFLEVPEASIREILGQLDKKSLSIALKGASEELKNHIFKSMSSRAVEMLKEDMEVLGPIRARDVEAAQQETVDLARKLEAQGKLTLKSAMEDEFIV